MGKKRNYIGMTCEYCNCKFNSKTRNLKQRFCTKKCAGKGNNNSGRLMKGCVPWNKGITGKDSHSFGVKFCEERKEKIRQSHLGEKSYLWKGGVSSKNELIRKSNKFKDWRNQVFTRDNYTCQECNARSSAGNRIVIHPHHIKFLSKYPELAYDVDNGVTLCKECHQRIHSGIKLTGKTATLQKL